MKAATTRENLKKYRKLYYKKPKKKVGFFKSVFALLMIWQLIVWQVVLPFNLKIAIAADTGTTAGISASAPADSPSKSDDSSSSNTADTAKSNQASKDTSATGDVSKTTDANKDSNTADNKSTIDSSPKTADQNSTSKDSNTQTVDASTNQTKSADTNSTSSDPAPASQSDQPAAQAVQSGTTAETPANPNPADNATATKTDAPALAQGSQDLWKNCNLDSDRLDLLNDKGNSCKSKESCDEIKKCLDGIVSNDNQAVVANDSTAASSAGGNTIADNANADPPAGDSNNADAVSTTNADTSATAPDSTGAIVSNPADNSGAALPADSQNADPNQNNDNSPSTNNTISNTEQTTKPDPAIATGDANAQADVVNQVNTNIVSDNYAESTTNIEGNYNGDINLLDNFNSLLTSANSLNQNNQQALASATVIQNDNQAQVTNQVSVSANTGANTIVSGSADPAINTGDATAAANVVNIVNTNIVGNTWLFTVVNVFGNWVGNLIVPGEGLLNVPGAPAVDNIKVVNDNQANISNIAAALANTGGNQIANAGGASIDTGNAISGANIKNIANTNIVRNNWFFLMVNNMGSWVGHVINWNSQDNSYSDVFSYDFGTIAGGADSVKQRILAIFNHNSATVDNNVQAAANTGDNTIFGDSGNAEISTGDASAFSRIVNFVNTNIVGNNWLFGVVNVFGSWKGNVEFAYPDLAVSIHGDKPNAQPGDTITYDVTYQNEGKADASNVSAMVSFPAEESGGDVSKDLGTLKAGESQSFSVSAKIADNLPVGTTVLTASAGIKTGTKEINLDNNSASCDTTVQVNPPSVVPLTKFSNPALTISQEADQQKVKKGDSAKYSIIISNTGDAPLSGIVVSDSFEDKGGSVGTYQWTIGDLDAGKKAKVAFDVSFNAGARTGDYKSDASGFGYDPEGNKVVAGNASATVAVYGGDSQFKIVSQKNSDVSGGGYTWEYYTYYINNGTGGKDPQNGIVQAAEAAGPGNSKNILGATQIGSAPEEFPVWYWLLMMPLVVTVARNHFKKREDEDEPTPLK